MSYLFIKISFEEKVCIVFIKNIKFKKNKKKQKNIFNGFFRWVFLGFLGGFFWVGFLPTLT